MLFEDFQDGHHMGGHLGTGNQTILEILNLHVALMPPVVSAQSYLRFRRRCHLKNFKMAAIAAILDTGTERFQQF